MANITINGGNFNNFSAGGGGGGGGRRPNGGKKGLGGGCGGSGGPLVSALLIRMSNRASGSDSGCAVVLPTSSGRLPPEEVARTQSLAEPSPSRWQSAEPSPSRQNTQNPVTSTGDTQNAVPPVRRTQILPLRRTEPFPSAIRRTQILPLEYTEHETDTLQPLTGSLPGRQYEEL
ncbi:hypothetical protein Neosp_002424 [[Neocosmospora] mangrovei]